MGFQDDWMMRQIEMMAKFVANVVFKKDTSDVEYALVGSIGDTDTLTHTDTIYLELMMLVKEGKYGEAEDLLFDNIEYSDKYIELAADFYKRLNSLSNEQLENGGFSRDEVYDGYIEIMSLLGVPIDVFGASDRSDYQ